MERGLENIYQRRSIRKFKEQQISDLELENIIKAGKLAPSARNSQPWHFIIIQNKDYLDWIVNENKKIMKMLGEENSRMSDLNYHNFYHAPSVIVVCGDQSNPFHSCDCGMAIQNMALAAHVQGIGSLIVASIRFAFNNEEVSKKLCVPAGYKPLFALALGYIDGELPEVPERKQDCVTYIK